MLRKWREIRKIGSSDEEQEEEKSVPVQDDYIGGRKGQRVE